VVSWRHEPARLSGEWVAFRQAGEDYPPLWHPGSRYQPTPQPSARWHREGEGYAQYFSLETDGAWAELVRYEGIRTDPERLEHRARLWQCWITEADVADLETFDKIVELDLDPGVFTSDDYDRCQALADEFRRAGYRGLVTPSAALPRATNLALFGPRHELYRSQGWTPGTNARPDLYVVVNMAADAGAPPAHIVEGTRHFGDPHIGYEAWSQARSAT
jgi:RES domain